MASEAYRENAAKCLRLAKDATETRARFILVEMAQAWLSLAEHADKLKGWIGRSQRGGGRATWPERRQRADAGPAP